MPRVADHVYDHCLAVCRDPEIARTAAVAALARAPRPLPGALGTARAVAVDAAPAVAVDESAVAASPLELAWLLAGTRPAPERAVVDLAVRHDLDRAALGRALDEAPVRAAARTDEILDRWEHDLRPALLAWLGPGECAELAAVLAPLGLADAPDEPAADEMEPSPHTGEPVGPRPARPAPSLATLLAAAPPVAAHAEGCDTCADRLRAMASVRSLLAQVPLAVAPPALRPTGSLRRVATRPNGEEGRPARSRRWLLAAVAAALVAVAAVAVVLASGDGNDRVAILTKVPTRNALAVRPAEVRPGQVFVLENTSAHALTWRATSSVEWLTPDPASGRLAPRSRADLVPRLDDAAPEGDLHADLTITAGDGSTALVHLTGSVEHPPTIAATIQGCTVTAHVEDESDLTSVELHWTGTGGEARIGMTGGEGAYVARVPDAALPAKWWVTAVDGRGNPARSFDHLVTSCS